MIKDGWPDQAILSIFIHLQSQGKMLLKLGQKEKWFFLVYCMI